MTPQTAFDVNWLCPLQYQPPVGKMLLILSRSGVAHKGKWESEDGAIGWAPLPKIPDFIKARIGLRVEQWPLDTGSVED